MLNFRQSICLSQTSLKSRNTLFVKKYQPFQWNTMALHWCNPPQFSLLFHYWICFHILLFNHLHCVRIVDYLWLLTEEEKPQIFKTTYLDSKQVQKSEYIFLKLMFYFTSSFKLIWKIMSINKLKMLEKNEFISETHRIYWDLNTGRKHSWQNIFFIFLQEVSLETFM